MIADTKVNLIELDTDLSQHRKFHRKTLLTYIGGLELIVSTVGEYPNPLKGLGYNSAVVGDYLEIGYCRYYETMLFTVNREEDKVYIKDSFGFTIGVSYIDPIEDARKEAHRNHCKLCEVLCLNIDSDTDIEKLDEIVQKCYFSKI